MWFIGHDFVDLQGSFVPGAKKSMTIVAIIVVVVIVLEIMKNYSTL